jgi:hypothetical protein
MYKFTKILSLLFILFSFNLMADNYDTAEVLSQKTKNEIITAAPGINLSELKFNYNNISSGLGNKKADIFKLMWQIRFHEDDSSIELKVQNLYTEGDYGLGSLNDNRKSRKAKDVYNFLRYKTKDVKLSTHGSSDMYTSLEKAFNEYKELLEEKTKEAEKHFNYLITTNDNCTALKEYIEDNCKLENDSSIILENDFQTKLLIEDSVIKNLTTEINKVTRQCKYTCSDVIQSVTEIEDKLNNMDCDNEDQNTIKQDLPTYDDIKLIITYKSIPFDSSNWTSTSETIDDTINKIKEIEAKDYCLNDFNDLITKWNYEWENQHSTTNDLTTHENKIKILDSQINDFIDYKLLADGLPDGSDKNLNEDQAEEEKNFKETANNIIKEMNDDLDGMFDPSICFGATLDTVNIEKKEVLRGLPSLGETFTEEEAIKVFNNWSSVYAGISKSKYQRACVIFHIIKKTKMDNMYYFFNKLIGEEETNTESPFIVNMSVASTSYGNDYEIARNSIVSILARWLKQDDDKNFLNVLNNLCIRGTQNQNNETGIVFGRETDPDKQDVIMDIIIQHARIDGNIKKYSSSYEPYDSKVNDLDNKSTEEETSTEEAIKINTPEEADKKIKEITEDIENTNPGTSSERKKGKGNIKDPKQEYKVRSKEITDKINEKEFLTGDDAFTEEKMQSILLGFIVSGLYNANDTEENNIKAFELYINDIDIDQNEKDALSDSREILYKYSIILASLQILVENNDTINNGGPRGAIGTGKTLDEDNYIEYHLERGLELYNGDTKQTQEKKESSNSGNNYRGTIREGNIY